MGRRRYYSNNSGFPEYVPVGTKIARNRRAIDLLRKEGHDVQPVVIEGRSIAATWWGKSWNANLERYADYSNRIGRGRSYVRHGAVLDLAIEAGVVTALVQGSRGDPYDVEVNITPLNDATWETLRASALDRLDSLADLLAGKFPKTLQEAFFARGTGLFPTPDEIEFDCSCPDWASMCKHVAAVLYGIGNRLDQAPELLFTLRNVSVDELVAETVDATAENLLDKADTASGDDVIADADIGGVFGIEFDSTDVADAVSLPAPATRTSPEKAKPAAKPRTKVKTPKTARSATGSTGKRKSTPRKTKTAGTSTGRQSKAKKRSRATAPVNTGTMIDRLAAAIPKRRKFFDVHDLQKHLPSWSERQVRNTISRAIADGRIERVSPGVYRRIS